MTGRADDNAIAARMADHFMRQIGWVEESLAAMDQMAAMPLDGDWDRVLAEDASRRQVLASLESEFAALKKEWDATPAFRPQERQSVRALTARLNDLAQQYQRKLDALSTRLTEAGSAVQGEMGTLRKARDVMQRFVSGGPPGATFVDRRA